MKVIGIVPARMSASRFPNKPMASICGMPMVGHCYHRTKLAIGKCSTYVATCDEEIANYITSIGGASIMTSSNHFRATTRTAEAMEIIEGNMGNKVDIVVMVQGDEPLILPETIAATIHSFRDPSVQIVNVMSHIHTHDDFLDKNNVKVVINNDGNALYFSREPIPSPWRGGGEFTKYMQTGIIAFRREALIKFNQMEESSLEKIESIDMNRVLEAGGKIRMIATDNITIGVDTPEELLRAGELIKRDATVHQYL